MPKKFLQGAAAAPLCLAIFFFPQTVNRNEIVPTPEIISQPAQVEEKISVEENFPAEPIKNSQVNFPEINLPTTEINPLPQIDLPTPEVNPLPRIDSPTPEINSPPAQVETSGEVELKFYLNGELTNKEHMLYLYDWQNWTRDKYGQYLFPKNWSGRLRIENQSGKDLINPQLEINIGDDKKILDLPAVLNSQSFELEIPLGNKLASPEKGSGHLQIILSAAGVPEIFLNKTFFLVK